MVGFDETIIMGKIFETPYFSCEIAHYGKNSVSILRQLFGSIDKIFILGVKLGTSV